MKRTREQKKTQMMARLEEAVDELLDWEAEKEQPNLSEVEEIILKLRKQMGEELAEEMLADMVGKTPVPGPPCPVCGKEMRYKGEHGLQLESRAGAMEYERGYYVCAKCDEGLFPPG